LEFGLVCVLANKNHSEKKEGNSGVFKSKLECVYILQMKINACLSIQMKVPRRRAITSRETTNSARETTSRDSPVVGPSSATEESSTALGTTTETEDRRCH
jgi:hypothetical protein